MKRVIGFALFWVAVGIILALVLPNTFVEVLCILLCVLAGYNLFFCTCFCRSYLLEYYCCESGEQMITER